MTGIKIALITLSLIITACIIIMYFFGKKTIKSITRLEISDKQNKQIMEGIIDGMSKDCNQEGSIHLGIIPDGNRRWRANNNNCGLSEYVGKMKENIYGVFSACRSAKSKYQNLSRIRELSIYILSKDNLTKRNDDTMMVVREFLKLLNSDKGELVDWSRVRMQFIGELHELPDDVLKVCKKISAKSTGQFVINIAIGYDPAIDAKKISSGDVSRPPQSDIDLVIRSGGEMRSSGFFPMHTLYSEWIYSEKLFPDLTVDDVNDAVVTYLSRNRRFGS